MTTAEVHTADTKWAAKYGTPTGNADTMTPKGAICVSVRVPIIVTGSYTFRTTTFFNYKFASGTTPNDYPKTGLAVPSTMVQGA